MSAPLFTVDGKPALGTTVRLEPAPWLADADANTGCKVHTCDHDGCAAPATYRLMSTRVELIGCYCEQHGRERVPVRRGGQVSALLGMRARLVTESCPACQAPPGESCRELIKLRLTGEVRPIRNRSSWHTVSFTTSGAAPQGVSK